MNKKSIAVLITFGLIMIAGWGLYVFEMIKLEKVNNDFVSLVDSCSKTTDALTQTSNDFLQTSDDLVQARKEISQKDAEIKVLSKKLTERVAEYNKSVSDLQKTSSEFQQLKKSITCQNADGYTFRFTSNSSISEDLKIFVGDQGGTIVSAKWETIWNNSKTAIHDLRVDDFKYAFLVYFDETNLDYTKSVFWIDRQCYLPLN